MNIREKVNAFFQCIRSKLITTFGVAKNSVREFILYISETITTLLSNIKRKIELYFLIIKEKLLLALESIKRTVFSIFNYVKEKISRFRKKNYTNDTIGLITKFFHFIIFTFFIFLFSFLIFLYVKNELYNYEICFNIGCIDFLFSALKPISGFISYYIELIFYIFSIFGIYYALKNYISTSNAAIVNIHLSNLNTFKEYLFSETKSNSIKFNDINVLKWYNLIYPNSRNGSLEISGDYYEKIKNINEIIAESNRISSGSSSSNQVFDHKKHQSKMIVALKEIGIKLGRAPRNNFKDAEGALFSIIDKVNKEFCGASGPEFIKVQNYN